MKTTAQALQGVWQSFAFATAANLVVSVEWSTPSCLATRNEPEFAVFGFPLPSLQFSGASSLEFSFHPLALGFNVVFLSALIFVLLRCIQQRATTAVPQWTWISKAISFTGILAAIAVLVQVAVTTLVPASVLSSVVPSYLSLRPVGISSLHYDCNASQFWFGVMSHASDDA